MPLCFLFGLLGTYSAAAPCRLYKVLWPLRTISISCIPCYHHILERRNHQSHPGYHFAQWQNSQGSVKPPSGNKQNHHHGFRERWAYTHLLQPLDIIDSSNNSRTGSGISRTLDMDLVGRRLKEMGEGDGEGTRFLGYLYLGALGVGIGCLGVIFIINLLL